MRSGAPWVTAYAVGNALGASAADVARSLAAGSSGLRPCRLPLPFETVAGHYPDVLEALPPSFAAYDSRIVRMAFAILDGLGGAVERAIRRWGSARVAIVLGTSTGGTAVIDSAPGQGTRVEVRIPLPSPVAPAPAVPERDKDPA